MLTHSYFILFTNKKIKKYGYIYWLNHPLQFDMFMTYIYAYSTVIPYIIVCVCVCVCVHVRARTMLHFPGQEQIFGIWE